MNKIIMITGATAGFGRAIAVKFAQNGYNIIITGRRKERLDDVEKELSAYKVKVLSLNFDVRKRFEVEDAIAGIPDEWKNIDILVNNAGLSVGLGHLDKGNPDDWDRMVDTNIKGLLYVTRAVAPLMVARKKDIFSISDQLPARQFTREAMSIAHPRRRLIHSTKSMRIDLLKHNIRVTQIAPGTGRNGILACKVQG